MTILQVLEEIPPCLADPTEAMRARLARRWARAKALSGELGTARR